MNAARQTAHSTPDLARRPAEDLATMLDFLDRLHPHTGSEALRALRETFPLAPLSLRVEAMMHHAGE